MTNDITKENLLVQEEEKEEKSVIKTESEDFSSKENEVNTVNLKEKEEKTEEEKKREKAEREEIERKCAAYYNISPSELKKRILSFSFQSSILARQERQINEKIKEINALKREGFDATAEDAFELGFQIALHDEKSMTWEDVQEKLEEIKERHRPVEDPEPRKKLSFFSSKK